MSLSFLNEGSEGTRFLLMRAHSRGGPQFQVEWLATGHEPAKKNTPDRRTNDGSPEFVQMPRHDIPGNARRLSVQSSQIVDHLSF